MKTTNRPSVQAHVRLSYPPIAKFAVLCKPSNHVTYIAAASFRGAVRGAQLYRKGAGDISHHPQFICWENDGVRPVPPKTQLPPDDFDWDTFNQPNASLTLAGKESREHEND